MKDLSKNEFIYMCERNNTGGALGAVEWCLEQIIDDQDKEINDDYASGRGFEELMSALWLARKELRSVEEKEWYKTVEKYDYDEDEDDGMSHAYYDEFLENNFPEIECSAIDKRFTAVRLNQDEVNEALKQIKQCYPESGSNGLTQNLGGGCPTDDIDNPQFFKEVQTASKYIDQVIDTLGLRNEPTGRNSYSIKHDAERWGVENGMTPYVSNLAAIVAMWINSLVEIEVTDSHPNPISNLPNYFKPLA